MAGIHLPRPGPLGEDLLWLCGEIETLGPGADPQAGLRHRLTERAETRPQGLVWWPVPGLRPKLASSQPGGFQQMRARASSPSM